MWRHRDVTSFPAENSLCPRYLLPAFLPSGTTYFYRLQPCLFSPVDAGKKRWGRGQGLIFYLLFLSFPSYFFLLPKAQTVLLILTEFLYPVHLISTLWNSYSKITELTEKIPRVHFFHCVSHSVMPDSFQPHRL